MQNPFEDLLRLHRQAAPHGSGLAPALLQMIEQKSQSMASLRPQPNVVFLGTASSQSGPEQHADADRVAADDRLIAFPRRPEPCSPDRDRP